VVLSGCPDAGVTAREADGYDYLVEAAFSDSVFGAYFIPVRTNVFALDLDISLLKLETCQASSVPCTLWDIDQAATAGSRKAVNGDYGQLGGGRCRDTALR
jgi:hypothetical protein